MRRSDVEVQLAGCTLSAGSTLTLGVLRAIAVLPDDRRRGRGRYWRYRHADHRAAAPDLPGGRELGHPPGRLPEQPALGAHKQWRIAGRGGVRLRDGVRRDRRRVRGQAGGHGKGKSPAAGARAKLRTSWPTRPGSFPDAVPRSRPTGSPRPARTRPHPPSPLDAAQRPRLLELGRHRPDTVPVGVLLGMILSGPSSEHCSSRRTVAGGTGPRWRAPSPRSSSG